MLLSTYINLTRCSKAFAAPGTALDLACARAYASAAEGTGAARWYKDVKVVPNVTEVRSLALVSRRSHEITESLQSAM